MMINYQYNYALNHRPSSSSSSSSSILYYDIHLTEARKAESDRVRFSISAPPLAVPGAKFSIDLWGYIRQMHAEVVESMKAKGQKEAGVSDKFYKIDRGSVITAVMSLPPKEFSLLGNRVQRVTWGGKKCQLEFPTKCNENAKLGSRPLCRCEIMFKLTVIEIEFRLEVGNEAMRVEELVTQQTKMPLKTPIIPGAAVQIKKRIGEGQFGEVFLAEYDKENVVVKYLKQPTSTSRRSSEQQLREFETEMALCHMLGHHPNVCAFRGAIREGSKMGIVTRFYENGSIEDYLHSSSQQKKSSPSKTDLLSDEQRLTIARDACSGLMHIHSCGVLHRDFAARNCLLDSDLSAHVSDFGLSVVRHQSALDHVQTDHTQLLPYKSMAPESISGGIFNEKSDAWMSGVLIYEVFTGKKPFKDMTAREAGKFVEKGGHLPIPKDIPLSVQKIMKNCFISKPEDRASIHDVVTSLGNIVESQELRNSYRTPEIDAPKGISRPPSLEYTYSTGSEWDT